MHRRWDFVVFLVTAVVLTGSITTTVPTVADASTDASVWSGLQSNGTAIEPDNVVIEVEIRPDGTARWYVRYRVRLHNQSTADAFASVRKSIEANRLERAGMFRLSVKSAVAAAENETGREMEVREVTVTTNRHQPPGVPSQYGVVTYEFEWTNFAVVKDDRISVGDALVDFFLLEDTTMLITWPVRYRLVNAVPTADENRNGTIVWKGPKTFTSDGPRVVIESTGSPTGRQLPISSGWLVAVGLLVVFLGVGLYRSRETRTHEAVETTPVTPRGEDDTEDDATRVELLSDEERVIRLLEEHGGRMKQQEVVETLDWSETKTSEVVKELHEAEQIERYRLGRENVLALPGEMDV